MNISVKYNRFFAYSAKEKKYSYTEFSEGVNVVHGKNTSGKSTFIQAILYTFGINDEKRKLEELLEDDVLFRLDFTIYANRKKNVSIVRDDEIIAIKVDQSPTIKFIGIGGNKSREHIKLKKFLSNIFEFSLHLEYENEYKPASIEAMFLPYYVAQDVGWVYRHKSFRGLDFVKNFKVDFFDYYLGIVNNFDRLEKSSLEKKKRALEAKSKILHQLEKSDEKIKLSKLKDEVFTARTLEYISPYKENKSRLIELEKEYLSVCNKITLLEESRKVLLRVKRSLNKDILANEKCPTCTHKLSHTVEDTYNYLQDVNDTEKQIKELNGNIKSLKGEQGKLNSILNEMNEKKKVVEQEYEMLINYTVDNTTFESWLNTKVNTKFSGELKSKLGEITSEIYDTTNKLEKFKPDDLIKEERNNASYTFKGIFEKYLKELKVKPFGDIRFYLLYEIPALPTQGVELLKSLLAYNFAFIKLIKETDYVHVLPLMLDAIFEGDFEDESKTEILNFIKIYHSKNHQLIVSIADSKTNANSAQMYNEEYFNNQAKLICIGNNTERRAFLSDYDGAYDEYLEETISLLS